ncbi:hypothetical protein ACHMW7_16195 [Aminobacter sp. UC22_36]|uniref:hypothetical protein n=1 Tax=Aminobacter sp. UC22_36 TaxID=3374549 RepID=UPI0037572F22
MALTNTIANQMLTAIRKLGSKDLGEVLKALVNGDFFYLGGTEVIATAAELNRVADVSTRVVTLTGATTIDPALHENKTLLLGEVGGDAALAVTLPAATGSGAIYKFVVSVLNTSGYTINKAGSDLFKGMILSLDNDANAVTGYAAIAAGDDVVTLNGTTTGGQVGDYLIFEDILAGFWHVRGAVVVPAGSNVADPVS